MANLDRTAVRYAVERNQIDLNKIDERIETFKAEAAKLVEWAKTNFFVPADDVTRFNGTIEDAISDLFYRVRTEIEQDVEDDLALVGEG